MKRLSVKQRNNWRDKFNELGFSFHSMDGLYWHEGICYEFSSQEIDHIEEVTAELNSMCLNAVSYVIYRNLFSKMGISERIVPLIKNSWERFDKSIYGRFDFSYDGKSEPKLLEFNADTPTALIEASVAQWVWLEDMFPDYDQFNSIHEKLQDAFKEVRSKLPYNNPIYFTCVKDHEEDFVTIEYMRDVAIQQGIDGRHIYIEDIGANDETGRFYDLENNEINFICKLYPWEWILNDEYGKYVLQDTARFFEPPWKMVLSNKGILPILWDLYPNHPNLLPAYFDSGSLRGNYVKKPLFSREGANITYLRAGFKVSTEGGYGSEGYIYQEAKELPSFENNYALTGSWIINGFPAGIGIREDDSPITKNTSRFVPHYFIP